MEVFKAYYPSPIGPVEISGTRKGILSIGFVKKGLPNDRDLPECVKEAIRQLEEYFKGERKDFSLRLLPEGTPFQKLVWQQLRKIPYGNVVSYGDVARAIGKPKAFRAVGGANNKNPIGIVVPCHRVIGSDGKMVGYGSGIWRKEWLLEHERNRLG
ncbi:MAG: methylated-DNA--[protein]-cysteine S-methyltransferase [Desulfobacterota bacterium]|jgi:methylated-DNA-[protein]-cysteine S-methyltransferase|nr:methylated-DNA--[protein]-cysteine S-methyltransferase [Thermodesulfobacteriota bacterium]